MVFSDIKEADKQCIKATKPESLLLWIALIFKNSTL